jgi:hypothetical protein
MLGRFKHLARCVSGSTMIEFSALIAVLLVIGYFVYDSVTHNGRRIVADSGQRVEAAWKKAVWPGTTVVVDDRIEDKYRDLDKQIAPAAGPR